MNSGLIALVIIVAILLGAVGGYYIAQYSSSVVPTSMQYTTVTYTQTVTQYYIQTYTQTVTQTVTQPATLKLYKKTLVPYTSISEPAGGTYQCSFTLNYPGYITVIVYSSTTTKTYVEISGNSVQGISYGSGKVDVGSSGSVSYPVLPGSVIVDIGNSNLINGATQQIEIIYYYYAPS